MTNKNKVKEIRENLTELSFEEIPTVLLEEVMTQGGEDEEEEQQMSQNLLDPQGDPSPLVAPDFPGSGAPWRGPA